ncbi:uncharacterized protein MONOS_16558 [Monocercomonoides exilis]|uniref:uncharacterized protein n=1 Tax=Monocercomonoides exilis TaxID=2049356 RepID=UPI00355A4D4E|nr:hypothetical protein MONOS_16558 [Monocercomonoides exilis]
MISGETTLETLEMEGFRLAEKENASSATTLPGKTNLWGLMQTTLNIPSKLAMPNMKKCLHISGISYQEALNELQVMMSREGCDYAVHSHHLSGFNGSAGWNDTTGAMSALYRQPMDETCLINANNRKAFFDWLSSEQHISVAEYTTKSIGAYFPSSDFAQEPVFLLSKQTINSAAPMFFQSTGQQIPFHRSASLSVFFSLTTSRSTTASFFRQSFGHSRNGSFSFRACGRFNHRSFSSVSSHQPVRALTHEQNTIFFLKNKQLKFDVVELRVTPDPTSPLQSVPDDQPYVCSFCEMRFVLVVSLPTHIHQAYSKMDMTELIKQLFEAEREYLLRGMKKITMLEKLLHIVLHIFSSYELSTLKSTENIHSQQVI